MAGTTEDNRASCLSLTLILSFLEKKGIPRDDLLKGLEYDEDYLLETSNWIDRKTFFEIENRMKKLLPHEKDLFFQVGLQTSHSKGFGFIRLLANLSGSPYMLYRMLEKFVSGHLFRFVSIKLIKSGSSEVTLRYDFDDSIEKYLNWIETARGILAVAPELVGFRRAEVSYLINGRTVYFKVRYLKKANIFKRLWRFLFVRGSVLPETYRELESAHVELHGKMNELEDTHEELKKTVAKVESLNELSTLLGSKIEINSLIEAFLQHMAVGFSVDKILIILSKRNERNAGFTHYCKGFYHGDEKRYYALDYVSDVEHITSLAGSGGSNVHRFSGADTERLKSSDVIYRHVFGGETCIFLYPLEWSGTILGYTLFGFKEGDRVGSEEERFFKSVNDIFSIYLNNALTYNELELLNITLNRQVEEKTKKLKSLNTALTKELEEKDRFDRLKKDFLMYVSHELKTPLMCILAPLEMLLLKADRIKDKDMVRYLNAMMNNTARLKTMVFRLLDYAKLESRNFTYEFYNVNLRKLLEECSEDFMILAGNRNIAVDLNLPDRPCTVYGNMELLKSAISNIVENAIKYSREEGSVKISTLTEGRDMQISIADNGVGIPGDELELIFQPFARGGKTKGAASGWGIGLPLARTIIQGHGGKIDVRSEENRGTCFTIHLPAGTGKGKAVSTVPEDELLSISDLRDDVTFPDVSLHDGQPVSEEKLYSLLGDISPMKYTILIVEDDEGLAELLHGKLSGIFKVITAANGAQALKNLESARPDLIISDIMMKPIDGLTLCEMIRNDERYASVPIILLTAMEGADSTIQGFMKGANDYLKKPFSMSELFVRIRLQIKIVEVGRKMITSEKIAALGMLMAGIAHEIKNPVNAIMNSVRPMAANLDRISETVEERGISREIEDIKTLLSVVGDGSERIMDVIQGIQRYVSAPELVSKELKIEEIIDTALKILNHKMRGKIRVDKEYEFNRMLQGSPGRLSQVFLNIIDNAISSINGEGVISIKTSANEENAVVKISDNGRGIPDAIKDRIFDPFFTTKEIGIGTGLGLSICKEIVEAHHGSMEVESVIGKGTEFRIYLPMIITAS